MPPGWRLPIDRFESLDYSASNMPATWAASGIPTTLRRKVSAARDSWTRKMTHTCLWTLLNMCSNVERPRKFFSKKDSDHQATSQERMISSKRLKLSAEKTFKTIVYERKAQKKMLSSCGVRERSGPLPKNNVQLSIEGEINTYSSRGRSNGRLSVQRPPSTLRTGLQTWISAPESPPAICGTSDMVSCDFLWKERIPTS